MPRAVSHCARRAAGSTSFPRAKSTRCLLHFTADNPLYFTADNPLLCVFHAVPPKVTLRQDNPPATLPFRWGIGRLVASAVAAGESSEMFLFVPGSLCCFMQRLGWDPIVLPIYIHGAFLPLQRQQLYDSDVTRCFRNRRGVSAGRQQPAVRRAFPQCIFVTLCIGTPGSRNKARVCMSPSETQWMAVRFWRRLTRGL